MTFSRGCDWGIDFGWRAGAGTGAEAGRETSEFPEELTGSLAPAHHNNFCLSSEYQDAFSTSAKNIVQWL